MNQQEGVVDQQVQSLLFNLVRIVRGKGELPARIPAHDGQLSPAPEQDNVSLLCNDIADECQRIKEIQTSLGYN